MADQQPTDVLGIDETVQLTVPAGTAYAAILRTVTAALAARHDFTLEEIDDLRIAIDEACALLLPFAGETPPLPPLRATFTGPPERLQVTLTLTAPDLPPALDQSSFAWLVLSAVADSVAESRTDDQLTVSFEKSRRPRD